MRLSCFVPERRRLGFVATLLALLGWGGVAAAQCTSGFWFGAEPMPTARTGAACAVADGKYYVIGGSGPPTTAVEYYYPPAKSWFLDSAGTSRAYACAGTIDERIYVVGGCINANCGAGGTSLLEVFDPALGQPGQLGQWSSLAPMPTPRSQAASGVIDGKLYVAGGMQACGPCLPLNVLEVYDPLLDQWSGLASMPTARTWAGGCAIDGLFYVVGGAELGGYSNTLEVYDPVTDGWSALADMPTPRAALGVAALEGLLYAISGETSSGPTDVVEVYSPLTNTWTCAASIPTPRHGAQPGVIDDVLYIAGSGAANTPIDDLEVFHPSCPSPETYCTAGISASGCQATLSASGSPSATAATGFMVTAASVEGNKDGLFFFGTNGRQANPWGNGTSLQCVVPPVVRAPIMTGSGTTGICDGAFTLDLNALWCPTCPSPAKNPGLGSMADIQLWYRDPASTSNQTTSLSNALEFTVCP